MMDGYQTLDDYTGRADRLPVIFTGHGSPFIIGEPDSPHKAAWRQLGAMLPDVKAVVCVSAHWESRGTKITAMAHPRTIHDFYGFPEPFYEIEYPAPGAPDLAEDIATMLAPIEAGLDHDWGLDHGCWCVLQNIYPGANIPILQLSLDVDLSPEGHYAIGQKLKALRHQGVLVIGSGALVHNLQAIRPNMWGGQKDAISELSEQFSATVREKIISGDDQGLVNWSQMGAAAEFAIPTPDHYVLLLYVLGMRETDDKPYFFNDVTEYAGLSMTSVLLA